MVVSPQSSFSLNAYFHKISYWVEVKVSYLKLFFATSNLSVIYFIRVFIMSIDFAI